MSKRNHASSLISTSVLIIAFLFLVASCAPVPATSDLSSGDIAKIQSQFMKSADYLSHTWASSSKALTPFNVVATSGSKATVPVVGHSYTLTEGATGSLANYPEPGQTTSWVVTTKAGSPDFIFKVVATTTFPAGNVVSKYVETYYVQAGSYVGFVWTPSNTITAWTADNPIMSNATGSWVQNQAYRESMVVTFADGTVRNEYIVSDSNAAGKKFAAFPLSDPLDFNYIPAFMPTENLGANYSSVTYYNEDETTNPNFSFWNGTYAKSILGVRYYTEFKTATTLTSTTVVFEKAVESQVTKGGSYTTALASVFVNSTFNELAETVTRQQVVYQLDGLGNPKFDSTAVQSIKTQTRVANITGQKDYYLNRLNTEAATLASYADTSIYTPTGEAQEIVASDPSKLVFLQSKIISSNTTIPLLYTGSAGGDLATLYISIKDEKPETLLSSNYITATLPSFVVGNTIMQTYDGTIGYIADPGTFNYRNKTRGTVEAWVYVNSNVNTAGIVHKGKEANFSDEGFSLQFIDANGTISFSISQQGPYKYDQVTSSFKLNTKKWYFLVGVWDTAPTTGSPYIALYVNGGFNRSSTLVNAVNGPYEGGPLVIGSQLTAGTSGADGYFCLKGKIYGVRVYDTAATASQISTYYNANKSLTQYW